MLNLKATAFAAAALGAAVTFPGAATAAQATVPAAARVTVQPDRPLGTIAPGAVGVNTPLWNDRFLDPQVPGLIRRAGITMLEFNGGGVSDLYHWRDGSLSRDPDAANHPYDYYSLKPQFSFDQFERIARSAGARTLVHVNYGTGTPEEAAGWVRYANKVKHYGVRDWVVGEEVWGNGSIPGVNFEPDAHQDKSPTAYATNALQFIKAMKAVDPTIRVGIEVTGINAGPFREWDESAVAVAGSAIDFVDFHRYPFFEDDTSDQALLRLPRQIPADLAALRELVGPGVRLVTGETNSAVVSAPQQISVFNALYLADNNMTLLENGAMSVGWWALHNGGYADTGGDLGLLSSGDGLPADTPFPPYYGMQILGAVAQPGAQLLTASSDNALVVAHAVREPDGRLAVLLINDDPDNAQPVRLNVHGRTPTVLSYGKGSDRVRISHENVRTLPPYSLTAIFL